MNFSESIEISRVYGQVKNPLIKDAQEKLKLAQEKQSNVRKPDYYKLLGAE